MSHIISYFSEGTCNNKIDILINKNIVESVKFIGGCPGSLIGISELVQGMDINEVIERLEGIKCGSKDTSCPDQLTKALQKYLEEEQKEV